MCADERVTSPVGLKETVEEMLFSTVSTELYENVSLISVFTIDSVTPKSSKAIQCAVKLKVLERKTGTPARTST